MVALPEINCEKIEAGVEAAWWPPIGLKLKASSLWKCVDDTWLGWQADKNWKSGTVSLEKQTYRAELWKLLKFILGIQRKVLRPSNKSQWNI